MRKPITCMPHGCTCLIWCLLAIQILSATSIFGSPDMGQFNSTNLLFSEKFQNNCLDLALDFFKNETCPGAKDGQIIVSATSTEPVEYQLNSGTFSNQNSWQNLAPGSYQVIGRLVNDVECADTVDITLLPGLDWQPEVTGNFFPCNGETVTYTTPLHAGSSYVWTYSGGGVKVSQSDNSITIRWTAGQGSAWTLTVHETDAQGCEKVDFQKITLRETSMICNSFLQVSLEENCRVKLLPDIGLEGTYPTYEGLVVTLKPLTPGAAAKKDTILGKGEYEFKITEPCTGNSCWGRVKAEDKLPPVVNCQLTSVACSYADTSVSIPSLAGQPNFAVIGGGIGNVVVTDNCSLKKISYVDEFVDVDCVDFQGVLSAKIIRRWSATDVAGNVGHCDQEIRFIRQPLTNVIFPDDITLDCTNPNTDPAVTGVPKVAGWPIFPTSFLCEINAAYTDQPIRVCDGTFKILRTWTVADWCKPLNPPGTPAFNPNLPPNPRTEIQVIKVLDETGPSIACPADLTAETDPFTCSGFLDFPDVVVSDACSRIKSAVVMTPVGNFQGTITDFPGNNHWLPDTLVRFPKIENLPPGEHLIRYVITDACGNSSACTFNLTVGDYAPPVAICDEFTKVSLNVDGQAHISADVFDDGSYDNCGNVWFKARRMDADVCAGNGDLFFKNDIIFCCSDVGDTVQIVVRVYDLEPDPGPVTEDYETGHYDDCMVFVKIEDKLKPTCQAPAHVTVSCDAFDPSLWAYGQPNAYDNCELKSVSISQNKTEFDSLCNRGTIFRTFTALDVYGNQSKCTQRVVVNYQTNFTVKFPDDRTLTECNATGLYGQPVVTGKDCELLATSYTDQVFTLVPDACFKILRTWHVIDWCNYDPNKDPYVVPNPLNIDIGPTVVGNANNRGNLIFTQVLKFVDNQKPTIFDCPISKEINDLTSNDPTLWKHANYWDAAHQSHDLCEAPVPLSLRASDACSGANVQISYTLQLDLNGDGVYDQTMIYGQPGSGLLIETTDSIFKTASFHPDFQLPHGKHKISWTVKDGCGNLTTCAYPLLIRDGKAPTVTCLNGLAANIMPTKMIALWATDFIHYADDNCTPANQLVFAIRKKNTGTGFPLDANGLPLTGVTFDCNELGTQIVEVWAKDKAGNASFCETYIIIQDSDNSCSTAHANVSGALQTEEIEGVQDAFVKIKGSNNALPNPGMFTNSDGVYNFNALPLGDDYTITPVKKKSWLNGVTTFDLLLMSKHILGSKPLGSPYKIIAADANRSGSLTAFDIVQFRKLILGVIDSLPGMESWRFVKKDHVFSDPLNPFKTPFAELVSVKDLQSSMNSGDFVGIKLGDVNLSAQANQLMSADDRTRAGTLHFELDDREIQPGETVEVPFFTDDFSKTQGFQFTLAFDPNLLELLDVVPGELPDLGVENFGTTRISEGSLTASWHGFFEKTGRKRAFSLIFKSKTTEKLSRLLQLSNRVTPTEAYNLQGEMLDVALRFREKTGAITASGVGLELYQNQPNPFSERTAIGFYLPQSGVATLTVSDGTGRVLYLVSGYFEKGNNSVSIEKSALGSGTGVLIYRLETTVGTAQRKMVLVE